MGRRTGRHATVAMIDTINTVVGTSPKNGLMRDASYVLLAVVSSSSRVGTHRRPKGIRQTSQRRCSNPSSFSKPHITIPGRRRQYERLRQSRQDLPNHDYREDVGLGTRISDPVANEQQDGCGDDGWFGAAVEQVNRQWTCCSEGEEEGG